MDNQTDKKIVNRNRNMGYIAKNMDNPTLSK